MALNPSGLSRRDLTEIKGFEPVLPELGKIKIGEKGQLRKSKSGTQFQAPQKLDHFKVTGLERGPDNNLLVDRELHKIISEKPRELDIVFPYNDIDLNFLTFYAWYSSRTARCKGNGEIAFRLDEKSGVYKEIECDPETCPYHNPPEAKGSEKKSPAVCKPNGILSVILMKAPRIGGVYKFRTTSYNTVRNIRSSLMMIRQLTGGTLAGIPLKLTLKPQTVNPKGMSGSIVVYTVSVEWVGTLEALYKKALESAELRAKSLTDLRGFEDQARRALTAGPDESDQEAREVAEEFYPDAVEADIVDGEIVEPGPEVNGKPEAAAEPEAAAAEPEAAAEPGDSDEKPAQDAQGPESPAPDTASPPVEAYEDAPPGDPMDDLPEGGGSDPKPDAPEPEPENKNRPTNRKKSRRI